jgi:hypothetical protein
VEGILAYNGGHFFLVKKGSIRYQKRCIRAFGALCPPPAFKFKEGHLCPDQ